MIILKVEVITTKYFQFHIKNILKYLSVATFLFLNFLKKHNNLYLMYWCHLKPNTDLPASYSAKEKKYWPILHNCHHTMQRKKSFTLSL